MCNCAWQKSTWLSCRRSCLGIYDETEVVTTASRLRICFHTFQSILQKDQDIDTQSSIRTLKALLHSLRRSRFQEFGQCRLQTTDASLWRSVCCSNGL